MPIGSRVMLFFNPKHFGVPILWNGQTTTGIFSSPDVELGLGTSGILSRDYAIWIDSSEFEELADGDTITIENVNYTVRSVRVFGKIKRANLNKT